MKIIVTILVMSTLVIFSGCHRRVVATVSTGGQQPAEEIYPSRHRIWVPGTVYYYKGKYVWREGRYKAKSYDKPVFVAAHWKKTSRGYVWTRGRWKKF